MSIAAMKDELDRQHLLDLLVERTQDGRLSWEKTDRPGTYAAVLPDAGLILEGVLSSETPMLSRNSPALSLLDTAGHATGRLEAGSWADPTSVKLRTLADLVHDRYSDEAMNEAVSRIIGDLERM